LSLPVRRWELLAGTFLGVLALALAGAVYASAGLVLVLGGKTGVWTGWPVVSAGLAALAFGGVYVGVVALAVWGAQPGLCGAGGGLADRPRAARHPPGELAGPHEPRRRTHPLRGSHRGGAASRQAGRCRGRPRLERAAGSGRAGPVARRDAGLRRCAARPGGVAGRAGGPLVWAGGGWGLRRGG